MLQHSENATCIHRPPPSRALSPADRHAVSAAGSLGAASASDDMHFATKRLNAKWWQCSAGPSMISDSMFGMIDEVFAMMMAKLTVHLLRDEDHVMVMIMTMTQHDHHDHHHNRHGHVCQHHLDRTKLLMSATSSPSSPSSSSSSS